MWTGLQLNNFEDELAVYFFTKGIVIAGHLQAYCECTANSLVSYFCLEWKIMLVYVCFPFDDYN
jgi:hypothetical protein